MDHLQYKRVWLALGGLMLAVVFAVSVNTLPTILVAIMMHDKIAHALAYACLMVWFSQIFRHEVTRMLLVIGLSLFGLGMEFIQGLVPGRQLDYQDMVANTVGITCSWALAHTWVGNVFVTIEKMYMRRRVVEPMRI
jgi:VanZ family protein